MNYTHFIFFFPLSRLLFTALRNDSADTKFVFWFAQNTNNNTRFISINIIIIRVQKNNYQDSEYDNAKGKIQDKFVKFGRIYVRLPTDEYESVIFRFVDGVVFRRFLKKVYTTLRIFQVCTIFDLFGVGWNPKK